MEVAGEDQQELAAEVAAAFLSEEQADSQFGAPKAGKGLWASNITVLNTNTWELSDKINLEQNEAAFRYSLISYYSLFYTVILFCMVYQIKNNIWFLIITSNIFWL